MADSDERTTGTSGGEERDSGARRCDFCRYEVELEPVTAEYDGETYVFCSEACRDRLADEEFVFAEYHEGRRVATGISGLDAQLPQGAPRNSFVLLSGLAGTRKEALQAEAAWRMLQRGEPVVAVTLTEPPGAFVQHFLTMDWNVLPYLERGQLQLIDAFTYRMEDRDRMFDRMNRWNRHLYAVAEDVTETVRDASDLRELENTVDGCLEAADMSDRGLVVIDSLTELGSLVQPIQAYDFVKDLRADVCKGRFVPVFAGATLTGAESAFPHDLEYVVDGVVQCQLADDIVQDTAIKRIRVKKMAGVLAISEWVAYEYTAGLGMVTFDPREEIEAAEREREQAGDGDDGERAGEDAADERAGKDASADAREGEDAAGDSPAGSG